MRKKLQTKRAAPKVTRAWGGFVEGRLDINRVNDNYDQPANAPAIYTTRSAARARYQDVRAIEIPQIRAPAGS